MDECIKTATYLLSRVLCKAIKKTPYELLIGQKPNLMHLHVWGYPTEVRASNLHERKLDARTIIGYFISYFEKSKRYRFYCPNHSTRIVESRNAQFIKNCQVNRSLE